MADIVMGSGIVLVIQPAPPVFLMAQPQSEVQFVVAAPGLPGPAGPAPDTSDVVDDAVVETLELLEPPVDLTVLFENALA